MTRVAYHLYLEGFSIRRSATSMLSIAGLEVLRG